MILQTPTGALHGSLLLPASKPRYPIVLIIAGSGPTDRNGNSPAPSGPNNSLKMLAEGLAAQGIASLRYDKRGIGESSKAVGKEADLIFTDYIDDVSGRYYKNEILEAEHGTVGAYLADPSLDQIPGQTITGEQRGDPTDLDAYLFLKAQFHYKLYKYKTQGGHKYRTRIRRQKIVF